MRIALISDIHGHLVALDAVLDDIARCDIDQIIFLGDVATLGPHPREAIARVRDLGCPCILGNHDDFLIRPELVACYTDAPALVDAIDWSRELLDGEDMAFLRSFQMTYETALDDGSALLVFHGSPTCHMENLLAETPPEDLDRMLNGSSAPIMACGHTHIQMLRQHRGMLIVNPGSVGLPFKEFAGGREPTLVPDYAEYATIDTTGGGMRMILRRVPVDIDELRAAAESSDNPLRDFWLHQYRLADAD